MTHIRSIDDNEATDDVAEIYGAWKAANPHRERMPDILKCFSLRPDVLRAVLDLSYPLQFQEGALSRHVKEMIATLVSALNHCPY